MAKGKRLIETETPEIQEQFSSPEEQVEDVLKSPDSQPELPERVEQAQEQKEGMEIREEEPEIEDESDDETLPPPAEPVTTPVIAPVPAPPKDKLEKEIESILEEDLTEMYLSMPAELQLEFKQKGEETVSKIRVMVSKTRVNAKKIFGLIKDWLKIIPGVNRFFLEQEAKIKTDKILLVTEEELNRGGDNDLL